jgi:hypothetical protein
MIPTLQPIGGSGLCDKQQLLLPAAVLRAAAAPLEHMLDCEMRQEEASVWVECVCSNAGAAMVLRACIVTQVQQLSHTLAYTLHTSVSSAPSTLCFLTPQVVQFGRDERPLLASVAARARTHVMTVSDVTAALSRVAGSFHRLRNAGLSYFFLDSSLLLPTAPRSSPISCVVSRALRRLMVAHAAGCGCWTGFRKAYRQGCRFYLRSASDV